MERFKRAVSLVLCMVMVLGFLPVNAFAADNTVLDAAIFCSDVHGSTSDLTSVLAGVKTSGVDYSSIGFVGDTCLTVANTTSTVQSALGDTNISVMFSYASSHDKENSADIGTNWDYSGEVENVSDDYLVYTIRETDMQTDSGAEADFTTWYSGLTEAQKALPIFIMSHRPLHARRDDNDGAAAWYDAISAAAESSDIVFFWAHNHTGETSVDTNAYYVAKNGDETISVQGGSTVTPNFTYMNAGYINANGQNPARKGVATTVQITEDSLIFQDYNSSGAYSGTYAHNVTVEREFTAGIAEEAYITSIAVTTMPDKTVYDVGEELDTTGMVVTATYSDGTTAEVSNWYTEAVDMTTEGEKEVTVCYVDNGTTFKTTFKITVEEQAAADAVLESIEITSDPVKNEYLVSDALDITGMVVEATFSDGTVKTLEYAPFNNGDGYTVGEFCMYHEMDYEAVVSYTYGDVTCTDTFLVNVWEEDFTESDVTVHVTEIGVIGITAAESDNAHVQTALADVMTGYTAYDIDLTFYEDYATTNAAATVTLPIPAGVTDPVVYYVSADGATVTNMGAKAADGVVTFTTDHFSTYAVGENAQQGQESDAFVPGTESTLETVVGDAQTIYQLVDTPVSGKQYLIVSTNTGTGYGLNSTTTGYATTVLGEGTYYTSWDGTNGTALSEGTYLTTSNPYLWTATQSGDTWSFGNGSTYVGWTSSSSSAFGGTTYTNSFAFTSSAQYWTLGTNQVTVNLMTFDPWVGSNSYSDFYLSYNNGAWTMAVASELDSTNVYFYEPITVYPVTQTGDAGTPDTTYHMDLTVDGTTVTDHAHTVTGVVSGNRVQMNAQYTATANGASTTVDAPAGGSYTVLSSSDESIATIGTDGVLTFTGKAGQTLVQVEYTWTENGVEYKTQNYVVITAQTPVYDMTITEPESTQVKIGATATLAAAVTADGNAADGTVTWSSSDESIATVDANGVVTGVKAGDVTITATYTDPNGNVHTDSVALEVLDAVYALDICKKTTDADGNETFESITAPIVVKDVDTLIANGTNTHSVWAVITRDGVDMGALSEEDLEKLTFISSDESIATVDKTTGVVTFVGGEGTVQITAVYTYAEGKSVTDTVTFSISRETYTIPSDGTDDFPAYPEEGAIRFDKTAVAQGSFSQTGIAKVELSMTGVPYTSGNAIDALLVLDMSTSMKTEVATDTTRYDVTATATKAFIKSIVQNDDGSYNDNTVCVHYFNGTSAYTDKITNGFITISNDEELETVYAAIDALAANPPSSSGTDYSTALETAYNTIIARDKASDNTQALVFMSDGGPTYYTYLNDSGTGTKLGSSGSNGGAGSTIVGWFDTDNNGTSNDETDDTATPNSSFKQEYYTYLLKNAEPPYPVYTVGLGLAENSTGPSAYTSLTSGAHEAITSYILSSMATNSSYFYNVADEDAVANMGNIFSGIAASIKEAATDVVVEDKIEEHYTMNFKLPNTDVTAEEAGMSEFYIQVVDYILDATTHQRTGNYSVLENITFNADGTVKSHTVDGAACGTTCSHVTFTDGTVTAIDGTYFDYTIDANGDEFLHWNAEKLTSTELALQYFVYLDESAGYPAEDQVDAGTYNTNEYATITYTNHLGNRCQQYFPIPSQTWMGAQVTYVFYLVNDQGQPVNRAGVVVPFAEAVYVTQPYTYDVTWNELEGQEKMLAENLFASAKVPDVYKLYDEDAYYEIRVYQTEGVDEQTKAENYNYFIIEGAANKLIDSAMDTDTTADNSTTKVYNTKAGTKYDKYGAYSATAGSYASSNSGATYTATVTNDIDYANTTVAFAVTWLPELAPDAVVIDYGLDVIIDVTANDGVVASVVGVRDNAPSGTAINSGAYTAAKAASAEVYIDANHDANSLKELKIGTATVESLSSVRFSLNKTAGMQFSDPAEFYYEADVTFYDTGNVLKTTSMYSSVTVIPATSIYYEDSFVTLESYTLNADGTSAKDETSKWTTEGTTLTGSAAVQDTDRPGTTLLENDADNFYGYDSHYTACSRYSMGSARKITVNSTTSGVATFSFYGTGFDVISMTSNDTGTIVVKVEGENGYEDYLLVDTFYGYSRVAKTDENGNTVYEWVVVENDSNALYQVPVMKVSGLDYGKYTVTVTASYVADFDHKADGTDESGESTYTGYDFYLDAIRIYDPANDGAYDETVSDAYKDDGEYLPNYYELRNLLISATTFNALGENETVDGIVFIADVTVDGVGETASVVDYANYGPNNELYLAAGQSVAFNLNAANSVPSGYVVDTVQIAMKSVGGTAAVKIWSPSSTGAAAVEEDLTTATDMYYDITALDGKTVVIRNTGSDDAAMLSVTNVKITYKLPENTAAQTLSLRGELQTASVGGVQTFAVAAAAETEETAQITVPFTVSADTVALALAALEEEETEPETTVPEETEPETTVPEETEPETTVPEETEPETTVPEETEPETTVPGETEPEDGSGDKGIWGLIDYIIRLLGKIFG